VGNSGIEVVGVGLGGRACWSLRGSTDVGLDVGVGFRRG
jgi:hypothetical protein